MPEPELEPEPERQVSKSAVQGGGRTLGSMMLIMPSRCGMSPCAQPSLMAPRARMPLSLARQSASCGHM